VDLTGMGSHSVAGLGIRGIKLLDFATRVLV
jgi:hypothetical protein